ncbi:hypothetical protein XBJ2_1680031 [Xenorhabdus bovienii str. Jollieti]|uniref:Uncharacterized protein n=1 Tax=Xenorhabdus bovienii (strain SS-2004) TaxID=406818 RepID=D3V3W7_XENBS|nr:hypothetical protein XBJ1_3225 [Xenorhabdus bovienii SS-2004]CDH28164.1 hypothetical protein XBJ2_1680031 [Xenorhabdus bovienii str. Jollieti]
MLMIYFLYYSESFFSHIYPSTLKYVDNPLFRIINQIDIYYGVMFVTAI